MQIYSMPPDTNEKQKILWGKFDSSQILQFSVFTILGVIIALAVYGITKMFFLGLIFMLPFVGLGILFALKKVNGMMLFQYLRLKHKYKKKIKYYVNGGFHNKMEFSAEVFEQEKN